MAPHSSCSLRIGRLQKLHLSQSHLSQAGVQRHRGNTPLSWPGLFLSASTCCPSEEDAVPPAVFLREAALGRSEFIGAGDGFTDVKPRSADLGVTDDHLTGG